MQRSAAHLGREVDKVEMYMLLFPSSRYSFFVISFWQIVVVLVFGMVEVGEIEVLVCPCEKNMVI